MWKRARLWVYSPYTVDVACLNHLVHGLCEIFLSVSQQDNHDEPFFCCTSSYQCVVFFSYFGTQSLQGFMPAMCQCRFPCKVDLLNSEEHTIPSRWALRLERLPWQYRTWSIGRIEHKWVQSNREDLSTPSFLCILDMVLSLRVAYFSETYMHLPYKRLA